MRIVCPSCQATYEVPETILAGGQRIVRCARCNTEWTPSAPAPVPAAPSPGATLPSMMPLPLRDSLGERNERTERAERNERPEPRLSRYRARGDDQHDDDERLPPAYLDDDPPSRRAAALAWLASIVVVLAVIGAAVAWRTEVMAAWPPSERLYSVVGLR